MEQKENLYYDLQVLASHIHEIKNGVQDFDDESGSCGLWDLAGKFFPYDENKQDDLYKLLHDLVQFTYCTAGLIN